MAVFQLFGRESELSALEDLVERLTAGRGGALVIRGDAGIGKSALLSAARRAAGQRGARVLSTAAVESEMHLPFAGLHQVLQPLLSGVERLPTPQRQALESAFGMRADAAPDLFLIALAALELVADAAAAQPVLIIAEDTQWLDRASSDALAFVARRVALEPILVLIALREGTASALDTAGLPERRLEPLDDAAAAMLIDHRAPDLPMEVRRRLLDAAAGNPLALEELPAAVAAERLPTGVLLSQPLPLTVRLERAFAAQVSTLPDEARVALLVAAADEGGIVAEVLAATWQVVGKAVNEEALEPAVAARLVTIRDGRLAFRHPLVRSAIYQAAAPRERRAAHGGLARILADTPGRSLWHRAAAAVGPDEAVASALEAGAEDARTRGAIAVAVATLERAAELTEDRQRRGRLLLRAGELGFDLGKRSLIVGLVRQAESVGLGALELGRLMWIREMVEPSDLGDAPRLRLLIDLTESARTAGDTELALNLLWLAATRCWWAHAGQDERDLVLAAAERMGSADDDPRLVGILAYAAPLDRGTVVIDHLSRVAAGEDVVTARLMGSAATVVGAFDLALPFLTGAAANLRSHGRLGHLPRVLVAQAWAAMYVSDWGVALPIAEEATRLAAETNDAVFGAGGRVVQAMVAAMRGEAETAEALVTEVERIAVPLGARFLLAMGQLARGVAALGSGQHGEAYEQLRRLFDPHDHVFHHFIRYWALGDLADGALHGGHTEAARALIAEVGPYADVSPSKVIQINLRYARAVLADDSAAEALFDAAFSADLSRWPFARGRLLLAYGAWLRRARRVAESRAPLRAARETFDAAGAIPWAERARQELRAAGESSRHRQPEARDLLTAQELQIARMAAEGLSNRAIGQQLFLSHRTVGSHLYHIFPKLGVTSRSRLAVALAGAVADPGEA